MADIHFCCLCGSPTAARVPEGDNRERAVCTGCGHVHYVNPNNVVGCLLHWQGQVLLCKRGIEPRYGFWTLPAGFMENGETAREGAAREAQEEALASSDDLRLFAVYSLPRISQVYLMYAGTLRDGVAQANEETLQVGLYSEAEIPWAELAFPVVVESLQRFFADIRADAHRVHTGDITSRPGQPLQIERF